MDTPLNIRILATVDLEYSAEDMENERRKLYEIAGCPLPTPAEEARLQKIVDKIEQFQTDSFTICL